MIDGVQIDQQPVVLMADDDPDDCLLVREALADCGRSVDFRWVQDGVDLLEYLRRQGKYVSGVSAPWPDVLLLDLNMPRKDGREALREIRADPLLNHLPIVILSTSKAPTDIDRAYDLGANTFVTKPATYDGMISTLCSILDYWLESTRSPARSI